MKLKLALIVGFLLVNIGTARAQGQQPFVLTAYGGLFFPGNAHFKDAFQVSSDLIYGFGIGLPIEKSLLIVGDMSFFKSEVLLAQVADSVGTFQERFIHVGLLSKQPFAQTLFLRLSGGVNYVTVKQVTTGPQSQEQSLESEKKLGYFGGAGIEQMLEGGRVYLFADIVYDYCRLHDVDFNGDFGGIRLVVGAHIYMF